MRVLQLASATMCTRDIPLMLDKTYLEVDALEENVFHALNMGASLQVFPELQEEHYERNATTSFSDLVNCSSHPPGPQLTNLQTLPVH